MATMYSVRVLAVEGSRLTCRVTVEYAGEPLTPDRYLAFRFIWEPWWDLTDGTLYHPHYDDTQEVVISQQEARERGQRSPLTSLLDRKKLDDIDWCVENADRFIFCVGVTDHVNYREDDQFLEVDEREFDPDNPPQATYTITVTDPAWLEHLLPGLWWPTSGCNFDGSYVPELFGWLSPTVVGLVRGIVADNALDRLPILADALEEAGCDTLDILNHCRGEGEHVRGCWVVHLLHDYIRRMG
jgi:hypothetical protein